MNTWTFAQRNDFTQTLVEFWPRDIFTRSGGGALKTKLIDTMLKTLEPYQHKLVITALEELKQSEEKDYMPSMRKILGRVNELTDRLEAHRRVANFQAATPDAISPFDYANNDPEGFWSGCESRPGPEGATYRKIRHMLRNHGTIPMLARESAKPIPEPVRRKPEAAQPQAVEPEYEEGPLPWEDEAVEVPF